MSLTISEKHELELLKKLKKHPFPNSPFSKGKENHGEKELIPVIRVITDTIFNYLVQQPDASLEIKHLIESKLPDYDLKPGQYHEDILTPRTLQRFVSEKERLNYDTSSVTLNVIKAFIIITDRQHAHYKEIARRLSKVAALYYEFVTHNMSEGKFQQSMLKINASGHSITRYMNVDNQIVEEELETELIGKKGLLLSHKESGRNFYLYIGTENQPAFLQGVYIYANQLDNTVANLAVFQRIVPPETLSDEEAIQEWENSQLADFTPQRELDELTMELNEAFEQPVESDKSITIKQNIQYFLSQKAPTMATHLYNDGHPFDFSKSVALYPGSHARAACYYRNTKRLTGDYAIYFNERFPSVKDNSLPKKTDFHSTIGQGILSIEIHHITGVLQCKLRIPKNARDEIIYEGEIINNRLKTDTYLIISFYSQQDTRYMNLLFTVVDDDKLIGCFNITYSASGQLGAGAAIAVRQSVIQNKQSPKDKPHAIPPFAEMSPDKLEQKIRNFLAKTNQSLVIPPDYPSLKNHSRLIYAGTYRMFYHSSQGLLRASLLILFETGYALRVDSWNNRAFGEAQQTGNALNITLKNEEPPRTAFCCIRVGDVLPHEGTTYAGMYSRISRGGDQLPIASLFLLEYLGAAQIPDKELLAKATTLTSDSPEMERIPNRIRKFFNGKSQTNLTVEQNIFKLKDVPVPSERI